MKKRISQNLKTSQWESKLQRPQDSNLQKVNVINLRSSNKIGGHRKSNQFNDSKTPLTQPQNQQIPPQQQTINLQPNILQNMQQQQQQSLQPSGYSKQEVNTNFIKQLFSGQGPVSELSSLANQQLVSPSLNSQKNDTAKLVFNGGKQDPGNLIQKSESAQQIIPIVNEKLINLNRYIENFRKQNIIQEDLTSKNNKSYIKLYNKTQTQENTTEPAFNILNEDSKKLLNTLLNKDKIQQLQQQVRGNLKSEERRQENIQEYASKVEKARSNQFQQTPTYIHSSSETHQQSNKIKMLQEKQKHQLQIEIQKKKIQDLLTFNQNKISQEEKKPHKKQSNSLSCSLEGWNKIENKLQCLTSKNQSSKLNLQQQQHQKRQERRQQQQLKLNNSAEIVLTKTSYEKSRNIQTSFETSPKDLRSQKSQTSQAQSAKSQGLQVDLQKIMQSHKLEKIRTEKQQFINSNSNRCSQKGLIKQSLSSNRVSNSSCFVVPTKQHGKSDGYGGVMSNRNSELGQKKFFNEKQSQFKLPQKNSNQTNTAIQLNFKQDFQPIKTKNDKYGLINEKRKMLERQKQSCQTIFRCAKQNL